MDINRFWFIVTAFAAILVGVTYLLHRWIKRSKLPKYLPALIVLWIGLYNIFTLETVREGFGDIIKILNAVTMFAGAAAGIVTGLVIDFLIPVLNKKTDKSE